MHLRLWCANHMGNGEDRRAEDFHQPVTAEHDQRNTDGGGGGGTDPPQLPLCQVGGGSAWQFRRQAEGRGEHEGRVTGQAPEQALRGFGRRTQGVQAGQHQGETDGHHQVATGGRQHALPAVLRLPGLSIMSVGSHRTVGVFMHFNSGRFGFFVGLGLQNQRGDPETLQQGQQQGGQQPGETCGLRNTLDHVGRSQWHGNAAL
ncbi:hypothetical protein D3C81_1453390 [compost metagenome]